MRNYPTTKETAEICTRQIIDTLEKHGITVAKTEIRDEVCLLIQLSCAQSETIGALTSRPGWGTEEGRD